MEIPQLTAEQKLEIRTAQFKVLALRQQARQLQDQSVSDEQAVFKSINDLAIALKVQPSEFSFNIETLEFQPRVNLPKAE